MKTKEYTSWETIQDLELKPHYSMIEYTGGIRGDRAADMVWIFYCSLIT